LTQSKRVCKLDKIKRFVTANIRRQKMRTDIHRPSVIQPQDYDFVGVWYDPNEEFEIGSAYMLRMERENIMAHMKKTQGRWARHEHGGTCHVCGANAQYLAVFYHGATNEYIRVGEDCTEKMDMGEPERFATARRAAKNARDAIAGKKKALLILKDLGLEASWKYYETTEYLPEYEESTCQDMVANLVRYGSFSDKQEEFLRSLLHRIENREAIKAQRAAEKASAQDCPTGRVKIKGTVLSLKEVEGNYGKTLKMFVKTTEGYTLWGTVPGSLHSIEKGEEVIFTATVEPARDDKKHGFFSRPVRAKA
jgi:hypothetical protein